MPSSNATPDAPRPPLAGAAALSVNALSERLVSRLVDDAARFGAAVSHAQNGTVLVDAGVMAPGSVAAGVLIARICMGGLGHVTVRENLDAQPLWPSMIEVRTSWPVRNNFV